jgi:hypothetical protein
MKGIIQINTKYRKLHSFDNIYCENILKQKSSSDFLKSSRKYSDMSYLTCLSRVFHLCLISPLNCHIILTITVIVVHHIIIKKKNYNTASGTFRMALRATFISMLWYVPLVVSSGFRWREALDYFDRTLAPNHTVLRLEEDGRVFNQFE